MNNILDKSLDSQFDKIENLTWFRKPPIKYPYKKESL